MKIEVKDKYTGKNIKEPNSEIPDPPKPKEEPKKEEPVKRRRRKAPLGIILPVAAIAGIIIGVAFAIVAFYSKSELIGTWVRENDVWTYEFKEDGTGTYGLGFGTPQSFHYKDEGDSIEITYDKRKVSTVNFEYHFEDGKLIIKDQLGQDQVYERK